MVEDIQWRWEVEPDLAGPIGTKATKGSHSDRPGDFAFHFASSHSAPHPWRYRLSLSFKFTAQFRSVDAHFFVLFYKAALAVMPPGPEVTGSRRVAARESQLSPSLADSRR